MLMPMSEEIGWLVELGSSPPRWWEGRPTSILGMRSGNEFTFVAADALRFARREDAERAIGWLVEKGTRDGCKAVEHLWRPHVVVEP